MSTRRRIFSVLVGAAMLFAVPATAMAADGLVNIRIGPQIIEDVEIDTAVKMVSGMCDRDEETLRGQLTTIDSQTGPLQTSLICRIGASDRLVVVGNNREGF